MITLLYTTPKLLGLFTQGCVSMYGHVLHINVIVTEKELLLNN